MKKVIKFTLFAILFVAISDLTINAFGPVWLLRLFGYENVSSSINYFPQWINNEEYYYLEIINYNDGGTHAGFGIVPMPYSFFTSKVPNADFLIYKVNINKPQEKKLIRKITQRVNFTLSSYWVRKINEEASFRIPDDKSRMALVMEIPDGFLGYSYLAYFLDINGHILRKQKFDGRWSLDGKKILNVSFDLNKFSLSGLPGYIKDITSGSTIKWDNYGKWISNNKSIIYDVADNKLKIYLADEKGANPQLLYYYSDYYKETSELRWDAAISKDGNLLFLNKIGIFKKTEDKWQMIKDLKDMKSSLYYPNLSPNGQRLVGVRDGVEVAVLELKDLLR